MTVALSEKPPASLLWTGHVAVWSLAALASRLSGVGSQIELHITGLDGAELAPEHLRQILTAPTTEFKAISFAGSAAAIVLAIALHKHSPKALRRLTFFMVGIAVGIVLIGYGH